VFHPGNRLTEPRREQTWTTSLLSGPASAD
jgi:hypothetical protein